MSLFKPKTVQRRWKIFSKKAKRQKLSFCPLTFFFFFWLGDILIFSSSTYRCRIYIWRSTIDHCDVCRGEMTTSELDNGQQSNTQVVIMIRGPLIFLLVSDSIKHIAMVYTYLSLWSTQTISYESNVESSRKGECLPSRDRLDQTIT